MKQCVPGWSPLQEEGTTTIAGKEQKYQVVEVEILEGDYENSRLSLEIGRSEILPEDYLTKADEMILVNVGENLMSGELKAFFVDFVREKGIIILFLIFSAAAFLIGGKTGFRSLLGSVISLVIIYAFIIPQILKGGESLAGQYYWLGSLS